MKSISRLKNRLESILGNKFEASKLDVIDLPKVLYDIVEELVTYINKNEKPSKTITIGDVNVDSLGANKYKITISKDLVTMIVDGRSIKVESKLKDSTVAGYLAYTRSKKYGYEIS